jgi:hypothetical membrane protein
MDKIEKKVLYLGGIIGPIVFLLNDIIGSIITHGFNPIKNAVSELTQRGSENVILLSSLFLIAAMMLVVFAVGIVIHYRFAFSKLMFLGGIFIIFLGIFSALSGTIFPMDPFDTDTTFPGTMHIVLTGFNIILIIMAIPMIGVGLYKGKKWKSFRVYSLITVLIMAICGGFTSVFMMNDIELLGLFERITIYAYQLWIAILAILLINEQSK